MTKRINRTHLDRFGFYLPSLRMYIEFIYSGCFFETPYKILIINGIYEV